MKKISRLLRTGKTVFSIAELIDAWGTNRNTVKATVYRMVKQKSLYRLKRGLYSLTERVHPLELGCKLVPGSYVSLFTVLKKHGVLFQEYTSIYLIAPRPQSIVIGKYSFEYDSIGAVTGLPDGIEFHDFYSIASLERGLLDTFCLFHTDYSDFKISGFDKEKFLNLSRFYNKKTKKWRCNLLKMYRYERTITQKASHRHLDCDLWESISCTQSLFQGRNCSFSFS